MFKITFPKHYNIYLTSFSITIFCNLIAFSANIIKNIANTPIIIVVFRYASNIKMLALIILPITSDVSHVNQYSGLYSFFISFTNAIPIRKVITLNIDVYKMYYQSHLQ